MGEVTVAMGGSLPDWRGEAAAGGGRIHSLRKFHARLASGFLLAALLAACPGARVQAPPGPPSASIAPPAAGRASFFFPVAIPLAEVRRIVEESVPPRVSDERKQEITSALKDGFYRYTLERGAVEVGFAGGELTFAFPVHGSLTLGGRLAGLPVEETVDFGGRVHGTASPAITPDWRPDPRPSARVDLDRADLKVLGVFPVSVRAFLEERLNPLLDQELRKAAGRLLGDLALRRKAEEAWRSLHVARRAVAGEDLWIRFQPLEVALARVTETDGVLHTGFGIAGQLAFSFGAPGASGMVQAPPVPTLLPPLRTAVDERAGGFEVEAPVAASPAELSRWIGRALQGRIYRLGRDRQMTVTAAALGVEGDRLVLTLDFQTAGTTLGKTGRLVLRGRPVLDAGGSVLRLEDLQYDLASGSLFLRLADRLHRAEVLAALQKGAHFDLAPLLAQADRETARALQGVIPAGFHGEVRAEPLSVLGVGIGGGEVWARCRMAGTISPLGP
jgi:hypothetical protein